MKIFDNFPFFVCLILNSVNIPLFTYSSNEGVSFFRETNKWHVKIAGNYQNFESASAQAVTLATYGITAFPAFNGSWNVYTGKYSDTRSLDTDFTKLTNILGNDNISKINPTSTSILLSDKNDIPLLLYDGIQGITVTPMAKANLNLNRLLKIDNDSKQIYRGSLELKRLTTSDMTVVNILPMEKYLYGVVPAEIGSSSPIEALKSQAVASRSYAYNNMGKYKALGFDLCNTVNSQAYKGFSFETDTVRTAVDSTNNMILKYNGLPAQSYFFASSGGSTEDIENVWGGTKIPYLSSVEDPYEDTKSSGYNWQLQLTAQKISSLIESKYKVGNIQDIKPTKKSKTGRVTELTIWGSKGIAKIPNDGVRLLNNLFSQSYSISNNAEFIVQGSDKSKSSMIVAGKKVITSTGISTVPGNSQKMVILANNNYIKSLTSAPTIYTFTGKGRGHGVGMSQIGARGFANKGYSFKDILTHYFTGIVVEQR